MKSAAKLLVVHALDEVREALDLLPETPLVLPHSRLRSSGGTPTDARDRESSTRALIALVEYLIGRTTELEHA
ncbi:hypothetical protein GCM10023083_22720 [Streptomyces phyllanthi]